MSYVRYRLFTSVIIAVSLATVAYALAQNAPAYTVADASAGATVYAQSCAQCHGTSLQGQSGPRLTGQSFNSAYPSPERLYRFISAQMPANAPGSLSATQYHDVTAFVLQRNGRLGAVVGKSGATKGAPAAGESYEIVRSVAPTTTVYHEVPSGPASDVSDSMLRSAASNQNDWLINGRTYDNDRYSPLSQITAANIAALAPVAIVQTGIATSFETTPIVSHGVMYLTSGTVNNQMKVMAVNAATGEPYWSTTYNEGQFQICCGPVNRGIALAYGMVYFDTLDDQLVALDARTGRRRWAVRVADPAVGYSETMAPLAYDGMILIGSAGGEWALRGFVAAYNAHTGRQLWRWYTTVPSTYDGNSWKTGGALPWMTPALDTAHGLLVLSTGNPNPDLNGQNRLGDNKWSDSIVGLDVRTGKFRWGYQEVKHDVWDYDATSPPVLFDVHENGKTIPAAAEAGKVGWIFIVNRLNGHLIHRSQNYVLMSKNMFSMPTKKGVKMLPGANGGAEWSPVAYSPQTHDMYVLGMDQLMNFTIGPPEAPQGHLRLGSAFRNVAPGGLQDGRFVAVNMDTGKVAWTAMTPQPLIGGALATGGGLAFMGEGNGWFDAYDARSGKRVWRYNLGAGVNAPPVTYTVGGVQYIAVAAGGNFQLGYPYGDAVVIFKLR